jgi:hypothetical protein
MDLSEHRWAPLVHGRTAHCGFRTYLLTSPEGLADEVLKWLQERILLSTARSDEMKESPPRWCVFKRPGLCVVGVACRADRVARAHPEEARQGDRSLYAFLGALSRDELAPLPPRDLELFARLYDRYVHERWDDPDYALNDRHPTSELWRFPVMPSAGVVEPLRRDDEFVQVWPDEETLANRLWLRAGQSTGPLTLYLNLPGIDVASSPCCDHATVVGHRTETNLERSRPKDKGKPVVVPVPSSDDQQVAQQSDQQPQAIRHWRGLLRLREIVVEKLHRIYARHDYGHWKRSPSATGQQAAPPDPASPPSRSTPSRLPAGLRPLHPSSVNPVELSDPPESALAAPIDAEARRTPLARAKPPRRRPPAGLRPLGQPHPPVSPHSSTEFVSPLPFETVVPCPATIVDPASNVPVRPRHSIIWQAGAGVAAAAVLLIGVFILPGRLNHSDAAQLLRTIHGTGAEIALFHRVVQRYQAGATCTEESWFVRQKGRRDEVRVAGELTEVVIRNRRWEFRYKAKRRSIVAWSLKQHQRLETPEDHDLLLESAALLRWAEAQRAQADIEPDRIEGRTVQKIVLRWPGAQGGATTARTDTIWFDPATLRPLRQRAEFRDGRVIETRIEYPVLATVPDNLFALPPREMTGGTIGSDLGR